MKLHIGSGKRRINLPGWINVDIDPAHEPDMVADCFSALVMGGLKKWEDDRSQFLLNKEQVEVIYACHVIEHCGRHQYKDVLKMWHLLLKPGGILRLSVPDLGAVVEWYYEHPAPLSELLGLLYGGQRNEHDYHKMGWDEETLTRDLLAAGFSEVRRWDWRTTEHAGVDDYSQSYLPSIRTCKDRAEYERGRSMSLNLECSK